MSHAQILSDRIAFSGIDQATAEALKDYMEPLKQALPGILEEFYAHIKKWPDLARMFKDQSRMDYAKNAQREHWIKLFSARFDEEYAQSVRKIGLIHSRIGLEPTWYIGAYSFTLSRLYIHAANYYKSRLSPAAARKKTGALLRALNQCVMIDMDMAISIYLEENKKSYEEKLDRMVVSFEEKIGTIVEGVSAAAVELEASARSMSDMANDTAKTSNEVSDAATEASNNVTTISSAMEEMSASISHVTQMATRSSQSSELALSDADSSVMLMQQLKESIDKVRAVTDLITGISEQTNLLALNATIEAARAGDAGKGFAVVAAEVKSLANETAQATEEIRSQVNEILGRSDSAVQSIGKVKQAIVDVTELSKNTAESVDQQQEAVSEIARNVEKASTGTQHITSSIGQISQTARETDNSASQVLGAVQELAKQGSQLKTAVNDFIEGIRKSA